MDVDIRAAIVALALEPENHTAAAISRQLQRSKQFADRLPSERAVRGVVREARSRPAGNAATQSSSESLWSMRAADPTDAALVMPVLRGVMERVRAATPAVGFAKVIGDYIAWVRRVAPQIPIEDVYAIAAAYEQRERLQLDTSGLDRYLILELWRDPEQIAQAFADGASDYLPVGKPGLAEAMQRRTV